MIISRNISLPKNEIKSCQNDVSSRSLKSSPKRSESNYFQKLSIECLIFKFKSKQVIRICHRKVDIYVSDIMITFLQSICSDLASVWLAMLLYHIVNPGRSTSNQWYKCSHHLVSHTEKRALYTPHSAFMFRPCRIFQPQLPLNISPMGNWKSDVKMTLQNNFNNADRDIVIIGMQLQLITIPNATSA